MARSFKTDLLWESLARLLRRNPFWLFPVLIWWMRGRAFLKQQLARRDSRLIRRLCLTTESFLAFLREQKSAGRKLVSGHSVRPRTWRLPVAQYVGLFDEVLASDGRTNLRGREQTEGTDRKVRRTRLRLRRQFLRGPRRVARRASGDCCQCRAVAGETRRRVRPARAGVYHGLFALRHVKAVSQ